MPIDKTIKKVLVIGSGPIVIGQAAEFDYAGAQACRLLKSEGLSVVLVNSNPATIMTDSALADSIYLEPLSPTSVKRIIEKEKPDSLLAGLGGQTGLNLAMSLYRDGFLDKHGVRLIGTNAEAIDKAEDRELFKEAMNSIGEPIIPSGIAQSVESALTVADALGYPVIVRPAFTLGGAGGGVAENREELYSRAKIGLDASPISQILVEKYIYGWKEIEFEVIRDSIDNAVAVCSMENFDPVGVHTGDSIVVAPALTLSDKEFQMLRGAALNIISSLKIVGGCNCQFALSPDSMDYAVIEVNPRVSRSSALASKATGYPIAKVSTKIALGYTLDEIISDVTGKTCACFEPALDYVAVKFPKWPFDKFVGASRALGTQMKATGEVMAIARSFTAAIMKAVRGAEISLDTLSDAAINGDLHARLSVVDDKRLFTVFAALKEGVTIEEINSVTKIDKYFLGELKKLADYENSIANKKLSYEDIILGKKYGYTDKALMRLSGMSKIEHISCVYKTVDTCAGEFEAQTPYFYSAYGGECESRALSRLGKKTIVVLGSGPIRIGQGIEFDYSSVHCVWTLKKLGYDVVIINNNPETVSTDYDTADRLYFEPLTEEDVLNVIEAEKPMGVVVAFGGQTAIRLAKCLDARGINILGTSAEGIDIAEDRERFDKLLESFSIKRPKGHGATDTKGALLVAKELGYPVLIRPSYVIGGQNMKIVFNDADLVRYMERVLTLGIDNPVLIDKYMMGSELEVDVISDGKDVLIPGVMQHIERAGVHSGDSIAVYPPYNINDMLMKEVIDSSTKLALALGTKGLVNIQYLIYQNELYVIEVNPRASRTIPYISKVTGVPMVDIASRVMVGGKLADMPFGTGLYKQPPYYAVKVPVFSYEKLLGANAYSGPEMKSTGEVLGIGRDLCEALYKGLTSAGMVVASARDKDKGVLISVDTHDQLEIIQLAKKLDDIGFTIYATPETYETVSKLGIDAVSVRDIREDAFSLIDSGKIGYVVYTGALLDSTVEDYIALSRKALLKKVPCFTSLDTANALADTIIGRYSEHNTELVDINRMRKEKLKIKFTKMQATGDDYIFIENFDGAITCPEALCVDLCDRHRGVGGYGIILIEKSKIADAKMRVFNRDGSEGLIAGNAIRCFAKYLYDSGLAKKETIDVETVGKVKRCRVYTGSGKVTFVVVDMGKAEFAADKIPAKVKEDKLIDYPLAVGVKDYRVTCLSMGNPHCVVFVPRVADVPIDEVGPLFENAEIFPERTNTEFVRVVNETTLKMRVYERGNGETYACGTGACAAVAAAVINGFCRKNTDVTVKVKGGDLVVNYSDERVTLAGDCVLAFTGEVEY